jgi:polysaccharide deacetylase family protein (PEP-CTERM system associated)
MQLECQARETISGPVISVDVEDWCQSTWNRGLPLESRAALNTERLLSLLEESGVRATLFVLGKFAEAFPRVVKLIAKAGHEIGSHGYGHVEIFKQSPDAFQVDVAKSKSLLEDLTGARVKGYRAPDFSIVRSTLWALDVLASLEFTYDSSIYPIRKQRYGIADWPVVPQRLLLPSGRELIEFPIAVISLFGCNLPIGGGGCHRLLPGTVARAAARQVLAERLFVYYCHPYEIDPGELWETDLPIPYWLRLHQSLGRGRFAARLRAFLKQFGGRSFEDVLAEPHAFKQHRATQE